MLLLLRHCIIFCEITFWAFCIMKPLAFSCHTTLFRSNLSTHITVGKTNKFDIEEKTLWYFLDISKFLFQYLWFSRIILSTAWLFLNLTVFNIRMTNNLSFRSFCAFWLMRRIILRICMTITSKLKYLIRICFLVKRITREVQKQNTELKKNKIKKEIINNFSGSQVLNKTWNTKSKPARNCTMIDVDDNH